MFMPCYSSTVQWRCVKERRSITTTRLMSTALESSCGSFLLTGCHSRACPTSKPPMLQLSRSFSLSLLMCINNINSFKTPTLVLLLFWNNAAGEARIARWYISESGLHSAIVLGWGPKHEAQLQPDYPIAQRVHPHALSSSSASASAWGWGQQNQSSHWVLQPRKRQVCIHSPAFCC